MNDAVPELHACLRLVHIGLGFLGLATFWLIIALPKGSRTHVRCGKLFATITWIVGGSAMISSLWAIIHLDSFAPQIDRSNDPTGQRVIYQFIFSILLYLSAATVSGAAFGIQVVRKRNLHAGLRATSLPVWLCITAVIALYLVIFGACHLATHKSSTSGMPWEAYFVPIVVGCLGIGSIAYEWRFVFGPAPGPHTWLRQHIWHMCGTGVAFHTAFLVFGANRLFNYSLPGAWALIPWVAPPLVGMSLTARYLRRFANESSGGTTRTQSPP